MAEKQVRKARVRILSVGLELERRGNKL